MKSKWCRTTDIHTFNGQIITEENMPVMCMCSDCGLVTKVNMRSNGTFFIRRHKIKDINRFNQKLEFEEQMKLLKEKEEKENLVKVAENTKKLYAQHDGWTSKTAAEK